MPEKIIQLNEIVDISWHWSDVLHIMRLQRKLNPFTGCSKRAAYRAILRFRGLGINNTRGSAAVHEVQSCLCSNGQMRWE